MESQKLHSASAYLNNLLLARGLLSNGQAINFAQPGQDATGTDATMSKIINLIHDLVVRRDRDAEHRETLATNIRMIQVEENQRLTDMQRMQDRNVDLARNLANAEAQERALKASLHRAEMQMKELKEQMLKMKSTLDQVRGKYTSEVRKRDVEMEKLKSHLAGMQRGKREASGMKVNTIMPYNPSRGKESRSGQDVNSTEWSLEKETNDFLAALVNETSTENVSLRSILGSTMDTLKELTAFEDVLVGSKLHDIPEEDQSQAHQKPSDSINSDSLVSCESLATQISSILEHCRLILKDPSFVPIEEVQMREDEILKLRTGWEKMASRWKDAVTMMDQWRRKMLQGDHPLDVHDLSDLSFGRSIAVFPNGEPVLRDEDELSSMFLDGNKEFQASISDEKDECAQTTAKNDEVQMEVEDDEESELDIPQQPSPKRIATSPARRGINLPRPIKPLREIQNHTKQMTIGGNDLRAFSTEPIELSDGTGNADLENQPPTNLKSRIPKQTKKLSEIPLTVSEKLAAIEVEAKEAEEQRQQESITHKRKPSQRQKSRKTSRRRSTLSPEELASLMGVR